LHIFFFTKPAKPTKLLSQWKVANRLLSSGKAVAEPYQNRVLLVLKVL